MSVYEKLMSVQSELKVPKSNYNHFGKYSYRSCEDICESLKPVLAKYKSAVTVSDSVETVGDRIYIKATAKFIDVETGDFIENTAFAREDESKKGMDLSQISGATSSYARKYCLSGLLLLDDEKDDDSNEQREARQNKNNKQVDRPMEPKLIEDQDKREIRDLVEKIVELYPEKNYSFDAFFPDGVDKFTVKMFAEAKSKLMAMINKREKQ